MTSGIIIALLLFTMSLNGQTGVAINSTGSAPDASALLDISGTGKGLLIPRMTLAQRPSSPVTGLIIYQTDSTPGFYYYNGAIWIMIASGTFSNYLPLAGGTLTGKLNILASSTTTAGLTLPHGFAPTIPVNGDVWTTTTGIFTQINGVTVGPLTNASSNAFVQNGNSFNALTSLGTNDNFDLAIKTNNTELMRVAASGSVGIGTSTFTGPNPEKLKVDAGVT